MTGHELTIEGVEPFDLAGKPLTLVGRCSCSMFSMLGPEQVIRDFHQAHLQYPDTNLTGKASK